MSRMKKTIIMAILGRLVSASFSFAFQPPLWLVALAFLVGGRLPPMHGSDAANHRSD